MNSTTLLLVFGGVRTVVVSVGATTTAVTVTKAHPSLDPRRIAKVDSGDRHAIASLSSLHYVAEVGTVPA